MIAPALSTPSIASPAAMESALASQFGHDAHPSNALAPPGLTRPCSDFVVPEWSPKFAAVEPIALTAMVDKLLVGMVGAGHGAEALSFYLGLEEAEVQERVVALGLAQPPEKRLRRPTSANPWSVQDIRLLIALWLENVAVGSMAATFARSPSSIHGKRRWLGLGGRDRKRGQERSVVQCQKTPLPWRPTFDVSGIVARLMTPRPGKSVVALPANTSWELGRDEEKDRRFSILGFAGLRSSAIARRMLIEFGVRLTEKAVDNRISRLQIVRERREMTDHYDPAEVERRASETMTRLGAVLRRCAELNRSFWWCRSVGGNRSTCREFYAKRFQVRKASRSCIDVMGMA
jgi:hypothetical protein